jgi:CheY-like chemotaxis protein
LIATATSKHDIERAAAKPQTLRVYSETIPAELKPLRRWVCWRWVRRKGRWTKPPVDPRTGRLAKSTDPTTWGTFGEALAYLQAHPGRVDGIGFVLGDGFAGVDLDDCCDYQTGVIEPWALAIVHDLDTYAELSPTSTGVKALLQGDVPAGPKRSDHVEMYSAGRYFTVTGRRLPDSPTTIEPRQEQLEALHRREMGGDGTQTAGTAKADGPRAAASPDEELVRRIARGKWESLWFGDTAAYGDDQSRADLALANRIAYFAGNDPARIDSLFRQSGLYRPKWDERRGATTYGQLTIAKALEGKTRFHQTAGASTHGGEANGRAHGPTPGQPQGEACGADDEPHLTDVGNARRVVARHGQDLRFCFPWKQYQVWDGRRWALDLTGEVVRRVKSTQAVFYRETVAKIQAQGDPGDDEDRKRQLAGLVRLLKHALAWEDGRAIDRCVKLVASGGCDTGPGPAGDSPPAHPEGPRGTGKTPAPRGFPLWPRPGRPSAVPPQRPPRPSLPEAARLFRALGDATRLRLLLRLADRGELSTGVLGKTTQRSRSATSKHLLWLRLSGVVASRRAGKAHLLPDPLPVRGRPVAPGPPGVSLAFRHGRLQEVVDLHLLRGPFRREGAPVVRVLVVDDNPAMRLVARTMLEAAGYEVAEAGSGAEALDALRGRRADVALCDLLMPGEDGLQTIRGLRALQPGLKVVAMSGVAPGGGADALGRARAAGAAETLRKPFDLAVITAAVERALRAPAEA